MQENAHLQRFLCAIFCLHETKHEFILLSPTVTHRYRDQASLLSLVINVSFHSESEKSGSQRCSSIHLTVQFQDPAQPHQQS